MLNLLLNSKISLADFKFLGE